MTQYVACRFKPGDTRLYTFANDGEPVKPGDFVEAISRGHPKIVEVASVGDEQPPFECAPVTRKVDKPDSWRMTEEAQDLVEKINDANPREKPSLDDGPAPTFD